MFFSSWRIVWTVFLFHLKWLAAGPFIIFTVVIQPLLVAMLALYMLRNTHDFQAIYIIVGSAMTGLWSGTLFFNAENIDQERWHGTLESIVASPGGLLLVILGKALANTCVSFVSLLFSYPLAAVLFGFRTTIAYPFEFVISLLLTLLGLVSLGLVIAPLMFVRPGAAIWANALEFPMYIVGGFLFPVILLPVWTTPLSYALSPFWAAQALHEASSGQGRVLPSWGALLLCCVIYWAISFFLFLIILKKARTEATLHLQ